MINKKGYSLLEAVIVVAVLGIVMTMLTTIVAFASRYYLDEMSESQTQEELRLVATYLEKDIRRFVSSEDLFLVTPSGSDLTVTLGDIESGHGVQFLFNDVNQNISRVEYNEGEVIGSQVLSSLIDNLAISLNTDTNPYVNMTLTAIVDQRTTNNDITTNIYLRSESSGSYE